MVTPINALRGSSIDFGKKPPLRTEGVPHVRARGCVTVPLGRRVVALGDTRGAGSLSATTRVLFRRPMVVKMMIVVLYRVGDGDLARSPRLSWGVASVAG